MKARWNVDARMQQPIGLESTLHSTPLDSARWFIRFGSIPSRHVTTRLGSTRHAMQIRNGSFHSIHFDPSLVYSILFYSILFYSSLVYG